MHGAHVREVADEVVKTDISGPVIPMHTTRRACVSSRVTRFRGDKWYHVPAETMTNITWAPSCESLILAETGLANDAIQIAGTAEVSQLPFFIAADFTLIGEELLPSQHT